MLATQTTIKHDQHYTVTVSCSIGKFTCKNTSAIKAFNKAMQKFSTFTHGKIQLSFEKRFNTLAGFEVYKHDKKKDFHWSRQSTDLWDTHKKLIKSNGRTWVNSERMDLDQEKIPHTKQLCGGMEKNRGITKPMYKDNGMAKFLNYHDTKNWSEMRKLKLKMA